VPRLSDNFALDTGGPDPVRAHTPFWKMPALTFSRTARLAPVLLFLILITLLGAQWWLAARDTPFREFRSRFDELTALETRWNSELLSLQLGFLSNYDNLTRMALELKLGWRDLAASTPSSASSLNRGIDEYTIALSRKIWLSEQIMASYAMLRNSVSVLPDAVKAFYQNSGNVPPVGNTSRLSDRVGEILSSTIAFSASPTDGLHKTLQAQMEQTRRDAERAPTSTVDLMDRFITQVEVVVRERRRSSDLMLAVTAVPTKAISDVIEEELQKAEQSSLENRRYARDGSILASLLLVVSLVMAAMSARQRMRRLREDNWVLHKVNENAEQQLMQSAKLSSLGQMVAGISHELNTPLAYVRAVFELIRDRVTARAYLAYPPDKDATEDMQQEWHDELVTLLDDGLHGLDEMAAFVSSMKTFSRLDKASVESFSIVDALEQALKMAAPRLGTRVRVKREFDPVPPINGSPTQLRQVFLNLIVNACDAMSAKSSNALLTLRTRHTASDMIQIDVADNGHGIEVDDIEKIFDPFFTTKEVGKGSGMGLSISYRIIENHGGTIEVHSKVGKGTAFTITLPRQDDRDIPASP